jgi:hypothetical protein
VDRHRRLASQVGQQPGHPVLGPQVAEPQRRDQQHPVGAEPGQQVLQEPQGRVVDELQVVDDQHQRTVGTDLPQPFGDAVEQRTGAVGRGLAVLQHGHEVGDRLGLQPLQRHQQRAPRHLADVEAAAPEDGGAGGVEALGHEVDRLGLPEAPVAREEDGPDRTARHGGERRLGRGDVLCSADDLHRLRLPQRYRRPPPGGGGVACPISRRARLIALDIVSQCLSASSRSPQATAHRDVGQ